MLPYKSMVIELVSKVGWGGARYALDFVEKSLAQNPAGKKGGVEKSVQKPWCFLEASSVSQLYLPSLSPTFRKAVAEGRLLWVRASESLAPGLGQSILESGLCEGLLLRELDEFAKSSPAALWGRRWQLAAKRSGTHLLWLHHKAHAVIGFDVRLEWTSPQSFEVKKGYGYLQDLPGSKTARTNAASAAEADAETAMTLAQERSANFLFAQDFKQKAIS